MTLLPPALESLDEAVLAAHAAGDGAELARLYGEAADGFAASGDMASACFFYTQAYIYALEQGAPEAGRYAGILGKAGRM